MRVWTLAVVALVALTACPEDEPAAPAVRFTVDPAAVAVVPAAIPGTTEGELRPVAVLVDELGHEAAFVENEIVVQVADVVALDALAARLDAVVVATIDPTTAGLPDLPLTGLLRVRTLPDVAAEDVADGAARLAEQDGAFPTGELRVTSDDGLRLLGLAAAEAEGGAAVGINWVGQGDALPDSTTEAAAVQGEASNDAFQWRNFGPGGLQDFGIAEAWAHLHRAGRLPGSVRVAVIDGGFAEDPAERDTPDATAISMRPWRSPYADNAGSCGGGPCPWHGQNVASVLAATVDDRRGSAGTAGPVADLVVIAGGPDLFTATAGVIHARALGARVINMSFSADIPTILAWAAYPFETVTVLVRASGTLLFAAAGNNGENVDDEDCVGDICWESAWHTPCENNGVICVGGLSTGRRGVRDENSNYGAEHVDIYGPFTTLVGPDPDHTINEARLKNGTSFSSPFVAGVAALVWAADPDLPADDVEFLVTRSANTSPAWVHPPIHWVKADAPVLFALQAVTEVEVTAPLTAVPVDQPFALEADIRHHTFTTSDDTTCTASWSSDLDGPLGSSATAMPRSRYGIVAEGHVATSVSGLSAGTHAIRVHVDCADGDLGDDAEATLTLVAENTPPDVEILSPTDGAPQCAGAPLLLRGSAVDIDELAAGLPESAYAWTSSRQGSLGTGPAVTTSVLTAVGAHTITLEATDRYGAVGSDSIAVNVLAGTHPDCVDTPPAARITFPADNAVIDAIGPDATDWYIDVVLRAEVSDAEDPASALSVTWQSDVEGPLGSGATLPVRLHARGGVSTRHTVTLRVQDSAGNVRTDQVRVFVSVFI